MDFDLNKPFIKLYFLIINDYDVLIFYKIVFIFIDKDNILLN